MSVAFSVGVYLLVGGVVVAWLVTTTRLGRGPTTLLAWVFWPAYLPVCLQPVNPTSARSETSLRGLASRLTELPLEPERRARYTSALGRLEIALARRESELLRLEAVTQRLEQLAGEADPSAKTVIDAERTRVDTTKGQLRADVARARAQLVGLAVRLEVLAVRAPREPLLEPLLAFEAELDELLSAQEEVAQLG